MALTFILLILVCILKPLISYIIDPKSLRKHHPLTPLSALTSLSHIHTHLTHPFRTSHLYTQHKTHSIIRTGPNALSFADPRAIKDIYGHGTPCRKDDIYIVTAGSLAHVLNAVDRDEHARKRRELAHAFSTKNLVLWEDRIAEKVTALISVFDGIHTPAPAPTTTSEVPGPNGAVFDFTRWSNLFTIDAIADLALSEKLHLLGKGTDLVILQTGERRELGFIESMHGGNYISSVFAGATDWFPLLKRVSMFAAPLRARWEHGANFGRIVSALTARRLERYRPGEQLHDLYTSLLEDKKGKPRGLEEGELEAEATVLLDAGSDTTAIALTHALYYLIKSPTH